MQNQDLGKLARDLIRPGSELVLRHLAHLEKMVAVDSRSFNVNEFPGDRLEPSDMREILELAESYLRGIGFPTVRINQPEPGPVKSPPILMADIFAGQNKPVVLMYAHLDKQPYMDDGKFSKWEGVPPWRLRWNTDHSRAYGRGAADDLSGVIAIGMASEAILRAAGIDPGSGTPDFTRLPCSLKIIYETEEESGSYSLVDQILQNREFFAPSDCVIITDVVNPATGVPGLTTSLRGIIQAQVTMHEPKGGAGMDAQTALYKMLATLVREDHSLAIGGIADRDAPVTESERRGYERVPIAVETLKAMSGLLPGVAAVVPEGRAELLQAQLRKSYANVRPGHRVAGGVVFGAAACRMTFRPARGAGPMKDFSARLEKAAAALNPFRLKLCVKEAPTDISGAAALDLFVQSADKDPHSGVNGGPFPIPEIQLARIVDGLLGLDGNFRDAGLRAMIEAPVRVRSLFADHDGTTRLFPDPSAKALVEIRLAPGNLEKQAQTALQAHLKKQIPKGHSADLVADKDGSPWMTGIEGPAFGEMLASLREGYGAEPCLYGCGGSIPFVAKLVGALGDIAPFCLGAYDPESRVHEPNESLSMADVLGCARTIAEFLARSRKAFPITKSAKPR